MVSLIIFKILQEATILAEDRRFYYHFGVDTLGILRATFHNILPENLNKAHRPFQQIARKVFLEDQKQ